MAERSRTSPTGETLVPVTIGRVGSVKTVWTTSNDAPQVVAEYLRRRDVTCVTCEGREFAGPRADDYLRAVAS